MSELIILFLEFFKTGLFAIGGGLATLPFLTEMTQTHKDWFTVHELADMVAVAESAPGAIGVNLVIYSGYKIHGIGGALLSVFALTLPSFIIVILIAKFLEKYHNNKYINSIFEIIKPATTGIIAAAGILVLKIALFKDVEQFSFSSILSDLNLAAVALFLILLVLFQFKKVQKIHPLFFIAVAAVIGIIFKI